MTWVKCMSENACIVSSMMSGAIEISAISLLSALSQPIRLQLATMLLRQGELCVHHLTRAIGAEQPLVSRHLGILRRSGLVACRRDGRWVYYRVNPNLPEWAKIVLRSTADAAMDQSPLIDNVCGQKGTPEGLRPD